MAALEQLLARMPLDNPKVRMGCEHWYTYGGSNSGRAMLRCWRCTLPNHVAVEAGLMCDLLCRTLPTLQCSGMSLLAMLR